MSTSRAISPSPSRWSNDCHAKLPTVAPRAPVRAARRAFADAVGGGIAETKSASLDIEGAIFQVGLLIISAKLAEAVLSRFGVNSIIAYTLTGIVLGPATGIVEISEDISTLLGIGVFVFFFLIGLDEIDIAGFVSTLRGRFFLAALACVLVSILSAFAVTSDVFYDFQLGIESQSGSLALASVFALSSLGMVVKVLSDNGQLRQRLGMEIFSIVLIAELVVLLIVGFALGEPLDGPVMLQGGLLVAEIACFAVVTWLLSTRVIPHLIVLLRRFLPVSQLSFGLTLGGLFLAVVGAEYVGLHGSLGALLFGASLSGLPHQVRREIAPGLHSVGDGLFVPLFFASAGLHFNMSFIDLSIWTIGALVLVPLLGKFAGAAIGAHMARLEGRVALATGLMAKGVAEIAILLILVEGGVIGEDVFSLLVMIMFTYILVTPYALDWAVRRAQGTSGSTPAPQGVPLAPSLARFVLHGLAVDRILDRTRRFPDVGVSVRDFADRWIVPHQEDYVVTDRDELAGIVSLRMLRYLPKQRWRETALRDVLRRDTPLATSDEPVEDALQRMTDNAVTVLPVMDEGGRLIGVVTSLDILDLVTAEAKGEM